MQHVNTDNGPPLIYIVVIIYIYIILFMSLIKFIVVYE